MPSTLFTNSGTFVQIWNSINDQVDDAGNPSGARSQPTDGAGNWIATGYLMQDGDQILVDDTTPPYWIDYVDTTDPGNPVNYDNAISYNVDPAQEEPTPGPMGTDEWPQDPDNCEDLCVDPTAYEDFEQYYDEDNTTAVEVADDDTSIGIRG